MTTISSAKTRRFGHDLIEHFLEVPWGPFGDSTDTFCLYAREIIPDGGEEFPHIVYLQGGPGFPAPRPYAASGLLGEMLKHYRVILLDQRGTGRSHRIDAGSDLIDLSAARLSQLRQEYIVEDAEALRQALGIKQWALFGQSFGGFCITSYLARYPESVTEAYLTGGLPSLEKHVDDVYRATFSKLTARQEEFFRQVPWANQRIREIAHHLSTTEELLPTGERLSARRFRTIGIGLGRGDGYFDLAYLLEEPFYQVRGEKRLRRDFLATVSALVSFEQAPLYAAIHESIYGGIGGAATRWSAHRVREELEGYGENLDPRSAEKYYLTGEHIFPWQFDEDPSLKPLKEAADQLAAHQWQRSPYQGDGLAGAPVIGAAVYFDDIYVPFELSLQTAGHYRDARLHVTNYYQHDGIRHDGAQIFKLLTANVRDH